MSDGKTFAYEDQLARVPLPTLEESCERFLDWCAPLLTADELAATEAAVEAFLAPDGPARGLHAALEEYDARGCAQLARHLLADRYLGRRDRIALNANFFFLFQDAGRGSSGARAAGARSPPPSRYKRAARRGADPAGRAARACRSRWCRTSTCSPPPASRASSRTPSRHTISRPARPRPGTSWSSSAARMFRMDVLGPDGVPHDARRPRARGPAAIMKAATGRGVLGRAPHHDGPGGVGGARRRWSTAARQRRRRWRTIETALFCVCLEDFAPADTQDACDELLHGDSGQPLVRQGRVVHRLRRRPGGHQRRALRAGRHHDPRFTDAMLEHADRGTLRASGATSQGPPATEPVEFVLDDDAARPGRTGGRGVVRRSTAPTPRP